MEIGLTFSPDGKFAYVTDTGSAKGFYGNDYTKPASMSVFYFRFTQVARLILCRYRFDVVEDGTLENRKIFAYVSPGIPDGKSLTPY